MKSLRLSRQLHEIKGSNYVNPPEYFINPKSLSHRRGGVKV
jgi:hypothetical protein